MIKGEKTTLRAIEPSDIRKLWEWMQDEEIMRLRYYPTPPTSLAEAEREYQESLCGSSHEMRFAITQENGHLIGEVTLKQIDHRAGNADFVIAIGDKDYWGRGYGTDATRALMGYAFEQLNLCRITLFVHSFNERAIRAYEKCGFRREGLLRQAHYMDGRYTDVLLMGLLRDEFESLERTRAEEAQRKVPVAV